MNPSNPLEDLARRIGRLLPEGADRLETDLRRNVRAMVSAALARMDLVSREEFEVQTAVLRRTREKLEALEARVAALEQAGAPPASGAPPEGADP